MFSLAFFFLPLCGIINVRTGRLVVSMSTNIPKLFASRVRYKKVPKRRAQKIHIMAPIAKAATPATFAGGGDGGWAASSRRRPAGWGETEVPMGVSSRRLALVLHRHLSEHGLLSFLSFLGAFLSTERNQAQSRPAPRPPTADKENAKSTTHHTSGLAHCRCRCLSRNSKSVTRSVMIKLSAAALAYARQPGFSALVFSDVKPP